MARSLVNEILPSARRRGATQESRKVEGVFEVDATVFSHVLHLLLVDVSQVFSLHKSIDEEVSETDDFYGVAADLKQAWDVRPKLLLLKTRVHLILIILLHL